MLDKDDQKEELFKRLKNIENARKKLTSSNNNDDDDDEGISYTSKSKIDDKDKMDSKPLNVFDFLKILSQEAEDLLDEIKDANDDIDDYNLLFIGSNREKFNFNIFRKPLDFLPAIYDGKMSLKEAEIKQRNVEKNKRAKGL